MSTYTDHELSPSPTSLNQSEMSADHPSPDAIASMLEQQMVCDSEGEEKNSNSSCIIIDGSADEDEIDIECNPYAMPTLLTALEATKTATSHSTCSQSVAAPLPTSVQPLVPTKSSNITIDNVLTIAGSSDNGSSNNIFINDNSIKINKNNNTKACPGAPGTLVNTVSAIKTTKLPEKTANNVTPKKRSSQTKTQQPEQQKPKKRQSQPHQQQKVATKRDNELSVDGNTIKPPQICINLNQNGEMPSTLNIDSLGIDFLIALLKDNSPPVHDFTIKLGGPRVARIHAKSSSAYRTIIHILQDTNIQYNTYQMREERSLRVVIKGIHSSTHTSTIKTELQRLGYTVKSVYNPTFNKPHGTGKIHPNLFQVEVDHSQNSIFKIKTLCHFAVSVEWPKRTTNNLPQCHRCQRHNHTAKYCHHAPRCVKCGSDHATTACTKLPNTPAKCANCEQPHTANYKGCPIRTKLLSSKMLTVQAKTKHGTAKNTINKDKGKPLPSSNPKPNPFRRQQQTKRSTAGKPDRKTRQKQKKTTSRRANQQISADDKPSTSAQAAALMANNKIPSSIFTHKSKQKPSPTYQPSAKKIKQNRNIIESDSDSDIFL